MRSRVADAINEMADGSGSGHGVTLMGFPKPPESVLFHAPERWGEVVSSLRPMEHLRLKLMTEPDGYVISGCCLLCGARFDRLLDFRALVLGRELDEEFTAEASVKIREELIAAELWAEKHHGCEATPIKHAITPDQMKFIAAATHAADEGLLRTGHCPHSMYFQFDGPPYTVAVPFIQEDGADRDVVVSSAKWLGREVGRAHGVKLTAVVSVTEAWVAEATDANGEKIKDPEDLPEDYVRPSEHPSRYEAVCVLLATPEASFQGIARIVRDGGVPDEGPGHIDTLKMDTGGGTGRMIDGIMASTDDPQLPEAQAWILSGERVR